MGGELKVTVIEGREVNTSAKQLGVRLKLSGAGGQSGQEHTTSAVATSVSPRWLKDIKLVTPGGAGAADAVLTVELFDGDAKKTLASNAFTLKEVVETGLIPGRWVQLTDSVGTNVAEVCLRLKFEGGLSEPSSSNPTPRGSTTGAGAGAAGGGETGTAEAGTQKSREERAKARDARAKSKGASTTAPGGARGVSRERGASASRERGASRDRRSARGNSRSGREGGGGFRLPKLKLPSLSLSLPFPDLGAVGGTLGGLLRELSPGGMLAAAAGIFLVGNFSRLRGPPQYYEVQEGDSLCTIAGCYNKDWSELVEHNVDTIHDPNVIYPGDRIRLS